jgi:hypothetical protein
MRRITILCMVLLVSTVGAGLLAPFVLSGCNDDAAGRSEVTGAEPDNKGIYNSNPFTLRTEGTPAELEVPETTYEFGRMVVREERSHAFVIRNVGDVPVRLAMGPSTCQCTIGDLGSGALQPGQETEVELKWKPDEHATEFSKGASIWTDVPEMPKIDFFVKGAVVPEVTIYPSPNLSAGMIADGAEGVVEGLVFSALHEDFEITSVESSHDWLQFEMTPAEPEDIAGMLGLKGYKITGRILPTCPLGQFRAALTLNTNIDKDEYRQMTILVGGTRSGPFVISGRGWKDVEYGTVNMGDVSVSEGKTAELSLIATPMGVPLELTAIESVPDFLSFEMRRDEDFAATNKERYYLTFSIPPDAPLGEWTGENAGEIKIHTNVPDREDMTFRVEFRILQSD